LNTDCSTCRQCEKQPQQQQQQYSGSTKFRSCQQLWQVDVRQWPWRKVCTKMVHSSLLSQGLGRMMFQAAEGQKLAQPVSVNHRHQVNLT
jgi:hypothetical protein